jgi:sialic acid synthase
MAKEIELAPSKWVGRSRPCFIIAEVGQNHQGDMDTAKSLIRAAKECGADCVKFQKTCLHEKFNSAALKRPYVGPNSWGSTYGEHKQHLEFSDAQFKELQKFALQMGIIFTASAMDMVSVDVLCSLAVPFLKIGSGDASNFPLLQHAATKKIPLVISTGMQNMDTVRSIYNLLTAAKSQFCLLHCVSAYPTPAHDINLRVIETYKREFPDIPIGYSGHELGTAISLAAVAMGAQVRQDTPGRLPVHR